MSDIFREVDEALQQEKLAKIWKEYGSTLILAAILLVVSTALTTVWVTWNHSRNATETARLVNAMEETDTAAQALQDIAEDTRSDHEAIALLSAAGMHADKGEYDQAAALYEQAYKDSSAERELRDLARILNVRSILATQKEGEQKEGTSETQPSAAALIEVLNPVLNNEKSPWQWPAKIDAALIAAHLEGDYKKAAAYLDGASQVTGLPPSLSTRATALWQLYAAQAAAQQDQPEKDPQG